MEAIMDYGIQLYSVRDLAKESLEKAIDTVARIGYSSIEFAGFFGRSSAQVNDALASSGIRICGTHSSWGDLANDYENTLRYHKELGNKFYTIPGADLSTPEKLLDFVEFLKYMTPKLAGEGIALAYHNHSREFIVNDFGVRTHDVLAKETPVNFEIDTYWAYVAGEDPVAVLEKYAHRMSQIHLKDGTPEGKGKALGEGSAPLREVVAAAKRLGLYMIVESETQTPDGPSEVGRCIDWLKNNG